MSCSKCRKREAREGYKWCAHCYTTTKARTAAWRQANRERSRETQRAWNRRNPDRIRAALKRYQAKDPRRLRAMKVARQYGVTFDEAVVLVSAAACGICGRAFGTGWRRQCIDHDHATGRVRGVLCRRCNATLGHLEESEALIARFSDYLRKHRPEVAA